MNLNAQVDSKSKWNGLTKFVLFLTILLAIGSFVLSFSGLHDFSLTCGYHPWLAWIWPLTIDGVIVAATIAVVVFSRRQDARLWYVWVVLILASVGSIAGNVTPVIFGTHSHSVSSIYMLAVGKAVPPIGLILMTHMSVMLADPHIKTPKITVSVPESAEEKATEEQMTGLDVVPAEKNEASPECKKTLVELEPGIAEKKEKLPEHLPTVVTETEMVKDKQLTEGEELPKRILKALQFLAECREESVTPTPDGLAEKMKVSKDTARRYLREAQSFEGGIAA